MPEIPLFYDTKGSKFKKNPLEKEVVLNSQNYDGYLLLMALILPFCVQAYYINVNVGRWVCVCILRQHI